VAAVDREGMVQWLERLQTLVRGEVWKGEEQNEVKVNESVLQQLVSQDPRLLVLRRTWDVIFPIVPSPPS
jgi:hypothetical protein